MRPVDLARSANVSQQAVRNYEAQGIIPPADRSPHGYRNYQRRHLDALIAFQALTRAAGHAPAKTIMSAVTEGRTGAALEALDMVHAQLLADRTTVRDLDAVLSAAASRRPPPEASGTPLSVGELARHLRVTPATLRGWERAGALRPRRRSTGHREYSPRDVQEARLVHLLRRGHFPLAAVVTALDHIHRSGDPTTALDHIHTWQQRLNEQGRALLKASADLARCLDEEVG